MCVKMRKRQRKQKDERARLRERGGAEREGQKWKPKKNKESSIYNSISERKKRKWIKSDSDLGRKIFFGNFWLL